jgi:hypothetical protein
MSATALTRSRHRRGFAAIFAISLIILVGSALVLLGKNFAHEFQRTKAAKADAQLRQLLITGAAVAIDRADRAVSAKAPATNPATIPATTASISVPLPPQLAALSAALTVDLQGQGDERTAVIRAALGERRNEQIIKLHREGVRWHVQ